eukprot:TRINITY_DN91168_c0_g1_i1.p1 TRINITY_DN91168_c0_g1~~TRINITY_DN91168_c0_g1_i1.p1  ORF type:complete len:635 (+),score=167.37 TRINITY_DN91168_c0_g1_i1:94-1998(+)
MPQWLEALKEVLTCQKRNGHHLASEETPFWEELPSKRSEAAGDGGSPAQEEEEDKPDPRFDQANHLKDEGKEKFERGEVQEAMDMWVHALDALCAPPPSGEDLDDDSEPQPSMAEILSDPKFKDLRVGLLLNLALGHKKLKQFRHCVSYCDEALMHQADNVKALFRKADAFGELCEWKSAEATLAKLEECGDEGKKLAVQKKNDWRTRRKAADGKQKKMWSAALAEPKAPVDKEEKEEPKPVEPEPKAAAKAKSAPKPQVIEKWVPPKVETISIFDLRRKGIEWSEAEDFDDKTWKDGLGRKEAAYYQPRSLPLSVLAGCGLAELDLPSEAVIHLILDGNTAPFGNPHDWSILLRRYPSMKRLTVIYIDIGGLGEVPKDLPQAVPYGVLLPPQEAGKVGSRQAYAARFLGSYKEFRAHSRDLPGLVKPDVALWADVHFYGAGDEDLGNRLQAFELLCSLNVPSIFLMPGEVQDALGPPLSKQPDDQAVACMAIMRLGIGAKTLSAWHWNRFVVPMDRSEAGILAAHALIAVYGAPAQRNGSATAFASKKAVKERLKLRGVELTPYKPPKTIHDKQPTELDLLRKKQWQAYSKMLKEQGRPVGPDISIDERNRQAAEFYKFCGLGEVQGPPPPHF